MSALPTRSILACALATALFACGSSKDATAPTEPASVAAPAAAPPPAAPSAEAAKAEATQIFATRCTPCHGPQGKGDGPASAGLTPKPRNFSEPAWQQSVTDDHIQKIIQYGGTAVGKSPTMPANPDLNAKPEVVGALAAFVRGLVAKP